jgi:hypothetical protein
MATMTTRKNKRTPYQTDRARYLGYERDKAALFRNAANMTQAEIDQRLIALADKWKI